VSVFVLIASEFQDFFLPGFASVAVLVGSMGEVLVVFWKIFGEHFWQIIVKPLSAFFLIGFGSYQKSFSRSWVGSICMHQEVVINILQMAWK